MRFELLIHSKNYVHTILKSQASIILRTWPY